MKGINVICISGNVGERINFSQTGSGVQACSFSLASDRHASGGDVITVWAKVNVYGAGLVELCRNRLGKGSYVQVKGELMNRDGQHGQLTEIRAQDIIFSPMNVKNESSSEDSVRASSEPTLLTE